MKKVILAVAIATMAQASMCNVNMRLAMESFAKMEHFDGKDKKRACYELKMMSEHLLNAKFSCRGSEKEIVSMLGDTESMYNKKCKGK